MSPSAARLSSETATAIWTRPRPETDAAGDASRSRAIVGSATLAIVPLREPLSC